MENIILELTDRLLALQARCAVAEDNLKTLEEQFHQLEDAIETKNDRIAELEKELDESERLYHFCSDKWHETERQRDKLREELAAQNEPQNVEEDPHVSEV